MKSSNLAILLSLVATVTTTFQIYPLTAQEANRTKLAQVPISAFADGVYLVVDPTVTAGFTQFEFRKAGNQITGTYVETADGVCVEGTVDGNTIVGKGYYASKSFSRTPQQSIIPKFNGSNLRSWGYSTTGFNLKVARQLILYLPSKSGSRNGFQVWSKYRKVVLNLDGYQIRDRKKFQRSSFPKKCELKDNFTGRVLNESELSVLEP